MELRQTATSLAMLFDQHRDDDRRVLREIYSLELWAMQIAFLQTTDRSSCVETDLYTAVVETLFRMCDRIGQVYVSAQRTT